MMYFDHNATTPLDRAARDTWLEVNQNHWGNPSAGYQHAIKAKAVLERGRERLAGLMGVEADHLVFCSGATEACNLWLHSFFDKSQGDEKLLVSELDHSCVVETCNTIAPEAVCWFQPSSKVNIESQLDRAIGEEPNISGVVMMAVNNVTGELFDWSGAADWCRRKGIPFFCDTTQLLGKYAEDGLRKLDFFCGSAHKFGGPKGVGFLKISRKYKSLCGQVGGGQESGIRAGTEDVAGILSMVRALEVYLERCREPKAIETRVQWKQRFKKELCKQLPNVVDHDRSEAVLWNTVNLSLPEKDSGWWVQQLDRKGFSIAAGAACSTADKGVSRIAQAMGIAPECAKRSVRLSAGWDTTERDWQQLLRAIVEVYTDYQKNSAELKSTTEVISLEDL